MSEPRHAILGQSQVFLEESRRLSAKADRLIAEIKQKIAHLDWFIESIRRVCEPNFFQGLQDAIRAAHYCESRHAGSFAVRKVRDGQVIWAGIVEEFELIGQPEAAACYAWHYGEENTTKSFIVLKRPPFDSAQAAVQLFLWERELPSRSAVLYTLS